jgi:hypothetical protein
VRPRYEEAEPEAWRVKWNRGLDGNLVRRRKQSSAGARWKKIDAKGELRFLKAPGREGLEEGVMLRGALRAAVQGEWPVGPAGLKFNLKLQDDPTLIRSKSYVQQLQKFKWKYGVIGFEKMNKF